MKNEIKEGGKEGCAGNCRKNFRAKSYNECQSGGEG